jgi:hypothetical protein
MLSGVHKIHQCFYLVRNRKREEYGSLLQENLEDSHKKTYPSSGRRENLISKYINISASTKCSWVQEELEMKNGCADEGQQQITALLESIATCKPRSLN